jgi:hypothetical protein
MDLLLPLLRLAHRRIEVGLVTVHLATFSLVNLKLLCITVLNGLGYQGIHLRLRPIHALLGYLADSLHDLDQNPTKQDAEGRLPLRGSTRVAA